MEPQPNQIQYTVDKLYLFPQFRDRGDYAVKTGHQAPPFNPARRVQTWEDPSATTNTTYTYVDIKAEPSFTRTFTLPAAEANHVNLTGSYTYRDYVVVPTDAVLIGPFGQIGLASADQVCMKAEADSIAAEVQPLYAQDKAVIEELQTGTYHYAYRNDPRRQWCIVYGSKITLIAQSLIEQKNKNGVGRPGHWTLNAQGVPVWASAPEVTVAPPTMSVHVPIPIRPLLGNEKLVAYISPNPTMAPQVVVHRTDLEAQGANNGTPGGGTVADIWGLLQKIAAKLDVR